MICDADDRCSRNAKYYRLDVHAKIPVTDARYQDTEGYVVFCDVVSDSIDEALGFVERMEDPAVHGHLIADDSEILDERSDDPKGLYRRAGRACYADED